VKFTDLTLLLSEDLMQWVNLGIILGVIFFFVMILEIVTKKLSRGRRI